MELAKLQHEYLGLLATLHIQEQMLEINRSHQEPDEHLRTPNLESEITAHISLCKRQLAAKALVLRAQGLDVPVRETYPAPDSEWHAAYTAPREPAAPVVAKKKSRAKPGNPDQIKLEGE